MSFNTISVSGKVTDGVTGLGLSNVQINVYNCPFCPDINTVNTDSFGNYFFTINKNSYERKEFCLTSYKANYYVDYNNWINIPLKEYVSNLNLTLYPISYLRVYISKTDTSYAYLYAYYGPYNHNYNVIDCYISGNNTKTLVIPRKGGIESATRINFNKYNSSSQVISRTFTEFTTFCIPNDTVDYFILQ